MWALLGRILLATIFILSGLQKIPNWDATAGMMGDKGLPMAEVLLALTVLIEVGAGLLLAAGVWTRWASLGLFLYLVPVTLVFHDFWSYGGTARQMQAINFLKNLAIMGGLLQAAAFAPEGLAFDAWRRRRQRRNGFARDIAAVNPV